MYFEMNRKAILFFSLIFILLRLMAVSAQCNSTQIDINSANATELDRIVHVGSSTAQKIIKARPFSSLKNLSKVSGFGGTGKNLNDVIQQGLACVSISDNSSGSGNSSREENNSASSSSIGSQQSTLIRGSAVAPPKSSPENSGVSSTSKNNVPAAPKVINLNSEAKTSSSGSSSYSIKDNPAVYGLAAFSVLLGLLFAAKKFRTKRYKSEFD